MTAQLRDPNGLADAVGDDVYLIDTRIAGQPQTTGCFLILGERPALIETGPSKSAPLVIGALAALGVGPGDLATIAVTHIHLDHAGGVGDLAQAVPRAEVVVHPRGARHLGSPTRLMDSAQRVYGDTLDAVFGHLKPTASDRLVAADDGHIVHVGPGRAVTLRYSPGHAKHHVVFLDQSNGDLYTGDAAGMYVPETGTYKPTTPPPEIDLDAAMESLALFRSMRPSRLMFSHFGPGPDVEEGLAAAEEEIWFWVERTRAARSDGGGADHVIAQVRAAAERRYGRLTESEFNDKWEQLSSTEANVSGILRWLDMTEK